MHPAGLVLGCLRCRHTLTTSSALQQLFFRWHAPEEPRSNPVAGLSRRRSGNKLVAVFTEDELTGLLATCKGGGSQNRRDYSVISLLKDARVRLSELVGFAVADVSPANQEAACCLFRICGGMSHRLPGGVVNRGSARHPQHAHHLRRVAGLGDFGVSGVRPDDWTAYGRIGGLGVDFALLRRPALSVNGHWEIRLGGLVFSGLAATSFPGWWPRVLPAGGG